MQLLPPGPPALARRAALGLARHPFVPLPFLFYYLTAARTIGMGDTAILVADIRNFRISAAVNSHNLSVLFGQVFSWLPAGSLAFRATLMSVLFGGLTVALFYALVYRNLHSRIAATAAAAILMVSHSMWWHSTIGEPYAINACLVTIALHLLDRYRRDGRERWLLGLIVLAGLSVFHHAQLGVIGLAALVVAISHASNAVGHGRARAALPGFAGRVALVGLVSLVPYLAAMLRDAGSGQGLTGTFSAAAGGQFKSIMFEWASGLGVVDTILLTIVQFPSPFLLLIAPGLLGFLWSWKGSAATGAVLTMFVTNTLFFAFFHTWDRFAFLLISFIILAFWGAFGLNQLREWVEEKSSRLVSAGAVAIVLLCIAAPPWVYANMTSWRGKPDSVWAMRFGNLDSPNAIDAALYNANPNKRHYTDIEVFAGLLFDRLAPDATYLTDDSWFFTLQYYRLYEGRRPDLALSFVNAWDFSAWGLSAQQLAHLLRHAHDADLPLYLGSLGAPFDRQLAAIEPAYEFERFPLDARHWVYRLITATETGRAASPGFAPRPRGTTVGYDLSGPDPITAGSVRADRDFQIRFDFDRNAAPFPVVYRWIGPTGQLRLSSPVFVVQRDSVSHVWIQNHHGVLDPGPWRAEVWVGGQKVDAAEFSVR